MEREHLPPVPQEFEGAVEAIRKREGVSRTRAMTLARQRHQHLFKAYQEPDDDPEPVEKQTHPDIEMFESMVTAFQKQNACPRLIALTRVARDHPTALEKYRKAQVEDDRS